MSTDDPLIGRLLGNFRLERVIGRGGMAQVYYGHDVKLNRPVAIKVIDARYRANPEYVKRFVREARAVAQWRHDNILQIYYADDENGLYYFVMEYIEGMDLGALIAAYNVAGELMPHTDVLRIGRAVASGLDYAHQRGVVHRDVKPSNVMVAQGGRVVLADFGLAMEVSEGSVGEVFGTARYISPEQARRSADAVPSSDLYSMGVMLFEMLTGVPPFDDASPTSTAVQHLTQPPPAASSINLNLTTEVDNVLNKALAKSAGDRFPTGKVLMEALDAALLTCTPVVSSRSGGDGIELPLPPPQWRGPVTPSLSQMSVVERVALKVAANPAPDAKRFTQSQSSKRRKRHAPLWWLLGGGVILGVVGVFGLQAWNAAQQMAIQTTANAIVALTSTARATLRTPTPTFTATSLPAPATATPTATPTASNTPTPTFTPSPTATSSPTSEPTVLYPDGVRMLMFYSENGFYLRNMGDERISVVPLAFEELDTASDLPTGRRYNGSRWADLYKFLDPTECNALEEKRGTAIDKRPVQCADKMNVFRTLDILNSQYTFWLPRDKVTWFRVLWREAEVGRCRVDAGVCEVYLPSEEE